MAETKEPGHAKTLEMRVAELEDKLSQMHVSEEEMKTYQKVAQKLGTSPCQQCSASPCIAAQQAQQPCIAAQQAQQPCVASQQAQAQLYPIYYRCYYYRCYYYYNNPIYYADCIPATGQTGGAMGGGGFGGFGT